MKYLKSFESIGDKNSLKKEILKGNIPVTAAFLGDQYMISSKKYNDYLKIYKWIDLNNDEILFIKSLGFEVMTTPYRFVIVRDNQDINNKFIFYCNKKEDSYLVNLVTNYDNIHYKIDNFDIIKKLINELL